MNATITNLEDIFTACAERMNDAALDGDTFDPAATLASFEDAHGVTLDDTDRAAVLPQLENVARAIATFGPAK